VSPLSRVFVIYQKGLANIVLDVSRIVFVAGSGYLSVAGGASALTTVWLMFAGQAANYCLTWVVGLWLTRSEDRALT